MAGWTSINVVQVPCANIFLELCQGIDMSNEDFLTRAKYALYNTPDITLCIC